MVDTPQFWEPLLSYPAIRRSSSTAWRNVCKASQSIHDANVVSLVAIGSRDVKLLLKLSQPNAMPQLRSLRMDVPEGCAARVASWACVRTGRLDTLFLNLKAGAVVTFDPCYGGGCTSLLNLCIVGDGAVHGLQHLREHLQTLRLHMKYKSLLTYSLFMLELSTFRQLRVFDTPTASICGQSVGVLIEPLPPGLRTISCLGLSRSAITACTARNLNTLNISLQQARHAPWDSLHNLSCVGLDATMYTGNWEATYLGVGPLLGPARHRITKLSIYGIGFFISRMVVMDMPQLRELTIKPQLDLGIGHLSILVVQRCFRMRVLCAEHCGLLQVTICPFTGRNLDVVSLRGNQLLHLPFNINSVRVLDLQGNLQLGMSLRVMPCFPKLASLNLSHCGLQHLRLQRARALRTLDVSFNDIRLLHLGSSLGLQVLRCNHNRLVAVTADGDLLPELKESHYHDNHELLQKNSTAMTLLCALPVLHPTELA